MPQEQKTQINFRSAYLFKFARLPAFSRSLSSKHTLENKLYESKKNFRIILSPFKINVCLYN